MDFCENKTPMEINKEGAFGRTHFKDTYSGINRKRYKKLWTESDLSKNIDMLV